MKMQRLVAIAALLYSAISWGLFWYPFRLLEGWGVGGLAAIFIAYLLPLLGIGWWYGKALWQVRHHWLWLTVLGFASGWSNVGYVLGVLEGEVMRVLLLFYLAPLWTVLLAWVFLRERLSTLGWWVIVLSLGGAMVMLWQPQAGLPLPANVAEWLGLSAGMTFALSVVAGRHLGDAVSDWVKTVAVWLGVAVLTGVGLLFYPQQITGMVYSWDAAWLLLGLAVAIALVTYAVQYGVARIPASQSSVIFLFQLVVAAIAAYWLTHERMVLYQW